MNKPSLAGNPNLSAIEFDKSAGMQLKDIAEKYNVSKSVLSRWFRRSAKPTSRESLQARLAVLNERSHTLWNTAELSGDSRGMMQAITAGYRAIELELKHAEEAAAAAAPAESSVEIQLELIDRLTQESNARTFMVAMENARGAGAIDVLILFENMYGNSELKTAILEFATAWLMEHPKNYAQQGTVAAAN
jgi:hypothetical protein